MSFCILGSKRTELIDPTFHRALQSAAQELERQRATDSLRKGLEKRPEKEELVERRIYLLKPCVIISSWLNEC